MLHEAGSGPQGISERLAGRHILVTGSTGLLAKVFVEKLLRSVPSVGGIHLLVRPKSDGTPPRDRVWQEVLNSTVFDRLRAALGEGFAVLCDEKVHVVGGDLTRTRLGLAPSDYQELSRRIDLVVNSAATVTFDERIDLAVELNAKGPSRLLRFARDSGNVPMMQVSTCYVCGVRTGMVVEDFSAPECARESLPRDDKTGGFDLDQLVELMVTEAAELRHRFAADTEMCRRELIEAGMRWARTHGWNDTYTFTKWIGEQLLLRDRGDVPLVVFRPAIIEGSFDEPVPGWIDGLRMADPIIIAYGRGRLVEFPGRPELPIDLIPVDYVANAMIATLPAGSERRDGVSVHHCASSGRHPLLISALQDSMARAFRERPMYDDQGRPIHVERLRLVELRAFSAKWERRQRHLARYQRLIARLGATGRRTRKLSAQSRQLEQLLYFARIYSPYTHLECRFDDAELRRAAERLNPADREAFPFDVERIAWDDYIADRHIPGLRRYALNKDPEPLGVHADAVRAAHGLHQAPPPAVDGANLFDLFRRAVDAFGAKPALQVRRGGRWLRYSYQDALSATGSIMVRLTSRGLRPGDRVAICAESGPEWGLTYLAIMRAGMTAVPLDPQLPPDEAWSSARFAEAKLMCASPETIDGLAKSRGESDADLVVLREPFVPRPGASRDASPTPVPTSAEAVASILFTSGTTVSPKAVQLSHANFIANARALLEYHSVDTSDELLSVLPMYHAFEFTGGFLVPLLRGATITYVERLNGPEILTAMQATGTTKMLAVPRLLQLFHQSIESALADSGAVKRGIFRMLGLLSDLSGRRFARTLFRSVHRKFGGRLRMFVCGGSRLDPELFDVFERIGFAVCEGYGLTETAPVLTVNPPDRRRRGSVGLALRNVELDIRNKNLEGVGEVWARGPSIMHGYLKNPQATEEVLVDGWFRTGDLGRLDAEGFLHLTGRTKDLIVTAAGRNVYPDEVELAYRDLPYIRELCVFGMPSDDGLGDIVHAVAVIDADAAPELDRSSMEREIRIAAETIAAGLPAHKRISRFHFWDRELPKTSTLKAKRGLIQEIVCCEDSSALLVGAAGEVSQDDTHDAERPANAAALTTVQRILAEQAKQAVAHVRPDMHLLLDLGIDSIGKLEILGLVEAQFNMRISDETAAKITRVSDVLRAIGERRPTAKAAKTADMWQRRLAREEDGAVVDGAPSARLLPVRWLVRGTVNMLMKTYIRVQARGLKNVPASGPFILAPNHSSHLDTPAVITALGGKRRVWVAAAEDYFFNTPVRRLVFGRCLDGIAVDRHASGVAGLRRCGTALRRGDGLLLFPEGTRSVTGELQPFKTGVALLAIERGVPIVPVHIDRAFELWPKGRSFARSGVIRVTFGAPIHPPRPDEISDHLAAFGEMTERLERAVRDLATEAARA